MILACPDCGTQLINARLANGTFVCYCPAVDGCRAEVTAHGKSSDEAADKFVERCERGGFIAALERKLQVLADALPKVEQGDLFEAGD